MRVLHILPSIHGYGAEKQVLQLLPRLQCADVNAGLLTIYTPSPEQRSGITFPITDAARNGRRDYTFVGRLVSCIQRFQPDIVHTHTHVGKYWGRFAAVAAGIPAIVHTEHNPCDPRRPLFDRLANHALNPYTSRCITFFPEQGQLLMRAERIDPGRVEIIPNGLDFDRLVRCERSQSRRLFQMDEEAFVITLVGRLEYQKNQELALRALSVLPPDQRANMHLFFAGDGSLAPKLHQLAASLGVLNNVRFLGLRSDVPELLSASDLLLMTSRFEGMPLTLLEAMHARVPIVSTPWLGVSSMLGGGLYGRISRGWSPDDVASEILYSCAHRPEVLETAERARKYASSEFSLSRMGERHVSLYRKLIPLERSAA
jgi:glycosyltransferase involved in cell wall biosynthesis